MINKLRIYDCSIIEFPKVQNRAGNISIAQNLDNLPFITKRVFYLYDIPSGEERGAHAHKLCQQVLIAASGSFDVMLDDGSNKKYITLNRPFMGLHIPAGIWSSELNFSSGAICLVLASEVYSENDYIREYQEYLKYIK